MAKTQNRKQWQKNHKVGKTALATGLFPIICLLIAFPLCLRSARFFPGWRKGNHDRYVSGSALTGQHAELQRAVCDFSSEGNVCGCT